MAKSRNNLLGVGGQRTKPARTDPQSSAPARDANRKAAAGQKQELLRKMRERAAGRGAATGTAAGTDAQQDQGQDNATASNGDAPAQD